MRTWLILCMKSQIGLPTVLVFHTPSRNNSSTNPPPRTSPSESPCPLQQVPFHWMWQPAKVRARPCSEQHTRNHLHATSPGSKHGHNWKTTQSNLRTLQRANKFHFNNTMRQKHKSKTSSKSTRVEQITQLGRNGYRATAKNVSQPLRNTVKHKQSNKCAVTPKGTAPLAWEQFQIWEKTKRAQLLLGWPQIMNVHVHRCRRGTKAKSLLLANANNCYTCKTRCSLNQ